MNADYPVQLQERVEQAIAEDKHARGQVVDTRHLAAEYGVTEGEMARVLRTAERKGLVRCTEAGFEILGLAVPALDSLFQHASRSGMAPSSQVRAATVERAGPDVAEVLGMTAGAPVYRMERTRCVNDEVVANQVNYIPYEICPGLEDVDLSHTSFQVLLEGRYHAVVASVREDYHLAPASAQDQMILSLPPEADILIVQRLSSGATGLPLVWADIHIRPDRYHYVEKLWPGAARALKGSPPPG